ncbi:MAG: ABC transporter substrate-binding protein [Myxococcales bacterium]|nr:ABC transporter substrate-binding protein [Myxococcales bacterium]
MQRLPTYSRALKRAGALGIAAAAASLAACSFIADFQECRTHADCKGADEPLACSAENTCVGVDDFPTCDSHQTCADAFGDDFLCGTAGKCISAVTAACPSIAWPEGVSRDKVVFLGSMIPVSPPYDAITMPLQNAIELAVEDFNSTTALPGGRKVAWLACDDRGISDVAVEAATHLVDEVGVQAIVGPLFSEEVLRVAKEVTIPAGAFLISPTASNKTITDLADDGLVWRTIPSDIYQSSAIRDRVLVDLDPKPASMVILAKDDIYGDGIIEDTVPGLEAGGLQMTVIRYADPTSFASDAELLNAYSLVVAGAFDAQPDVLLIVGTSEAAQLIGAYIQTWSDLTPGDPLPRFMVSHGAVPILEDVGAALDPALWPLLEGTSPIIQDPENFSAYNVRYKIRFNDQDALTTSSLSYDAAMVVMFSMATAGDVDITGARVAAGVARLVDKAGAAISFGGANLSFIKQTVDTLASGANVDLRGVSGELDFDLATGEVRTNIVGWDIQPKQGTTNVPVLTLARIYLLGEAPATTGVWMPLMP